MVEGIPDSFHEQVSYCFVVFLEPGRGRLAPWGIRKGFSVAPLHPSLLLAGAPTSELPVVLLSSCSKKHCPPHWPGSRPISRRSSGSSRLSRSRRNSGRRHPRPRSRPTPRTPPPTTWRPEIASARPAPGAGRWRHGSGRKATPRNTRERRGLPPGAHPSAPSGGKTNSFHWGWFT